MKHWLNVGLLLGQRRRRWPNRQTDRYFIDREELITYLFVIEIREIYVHVYTKFLTCQKIM